MTESGGWHRRLSGRAVVVLVVVVSVLCVALVVVRLLRSPPHRSACGGSDGLTPSCGRWWGSAVDQRHGNLLSAVRAAEGRTGRTLDVVHSYHRWFDDFPTASERTLAPDHVLFLNWQPTGADGHRLSWRSIAAGHQDARIDTTARRLRDLRRPVLLSFAHEPEADVGHSGSVADFVAAWRHVHDRFARDHVTTVKWVWTVMGLDQPVWLQRYPALWPGDGYVDWVGWDPYNWGACRSRPWRSFADTVHPFYDWLVAHVPAGMPLMLAEYGTVESRDDPQRKANWYRDEVSAVDRFPRLRALVYFDLPAPPANCDWLSTTSPASQQAFRALAHSSVFRATATALPRR